MKEAWTRSHIRTITEAAVFSNMFTSIRIKNVSADMFATLLSLKMYIKNVPFRYVPQVNSCRDTILYKMELFIINKSKDIFENKYIN